jgi:hypothetical protein
MAMNPHPAIKHSPPSGVMGPNTFLGPTSKVKRYRLPENMRIPAPKRKGTFRANPTTFTVLDRKEKSKRPRE